ncbi:MAG: hypothetical protein ACYDD2_08805 [Candidatus Acidiferrales bacterium]
MLRYRVYIALLIGTGFTVLVFLVLMSLGSNLGVALVGVSLLTPGMDLVGIISRNCCASELPTIVANGFVYSAVAFIVVWFSTKGLQIQRLRRATHLAAVTVVIVVALGWASARTLEWFWSAPSDDSLMKQFSKHRGDLETLVSMAETDSSMSRIADDFTWRKDSAEWPRPESQWGITADRWNDYRKLFRKVGLSDGFSEDDRGDMYFISYTAGSVVSGMSKGFVYCRKIEFSKNAFLPCTEQHDSGKQESTTGDGSEYRRLAKHWYLYSDWN